MSFSFADWLKSKKTRFVGTRRRQTRRSARAVRSARLNVEVLEDRVQPAALKTLASFIGAKGAIPRAGLVSDGSGNLFGTTEFGGTSKQGTVFRLTPGSGALTTLASFKGNNGSQPVGDLVMDSSGNLFGTTSAAGASGLGTLFEVA